MKFTAKQIAMFNSKTVELDNGCIEWTGYRSPDGYGRTWIGGIGRRPHRVAWSIAGNTLDDGKELDHLCRNRLCCNVDHLEAVCHRENVLRGDGIAGINARKDQCDKGHPFNSTNTRIETRADGRNFRRCITCWRVTARLATKRYRERQALKP